MDNGARETNPSVMKDDEKVRGKYLRPVARCFEWVLTVGFSFSAADRVYQQEN